jgi:hypothetical protein
MACARREPRSLLNADCTESQMMAMFGWTDPKMPAHYIAKANREKLGMSGHERYGQDRHR